MINKYHGTLFVKIPHYYYLIPSVSHDTATVFFKNKWIDKQNTLTTLFLDVYHGNTMLFFEGTYRDHCIEIWYPFSTMV